MDIQIGIGSRYYMPLRVTSPPIRYALISNIQSAAPVVITAPSHGFTNQDAVWITRCRGISKKINSQYDIDGARTLHEINVIDANTFTINAINAVGWGEYVPNSGVAATRTPVDLTGAVASMQIRKSPQADAVLSVSSSTSGVTIANSTVIVDIPASVTSTLPPGRYMYSVELLYTNGTTDVLVSGEVSVETEVTHD